MAGTGVGKFSSTAGSNTANMTVNFAENMAPSNVNNAARELMGHMRDMYEQLGDGYFEFGDGDGTYTVARSDADTITITSSSDISSVYFAGRKIRITDGGANVVEGTIASSSHSSTTQTVNLTGISLASGTPTKVELGIDTASFGGRVILDDDGDTYIEAPTDDTIDIYVAGAKDFVITANTFTAESGSTIAAQALTATSITSTGNIIIPDAGNIGSASDTDSIAIASDGVVTFSQAPVFPDGSIAVADLDIDGATDIGEAIVDADLFIIDNGAGGTNRKVAASRIKTYAGGALAGIDDQSSSNDDQITISDTAVIINEDSDDVDFRVESNGNANMIFVDGGNDRVHIGNSTTIQSGGNDAALQINGTGGNDGHLTITRFSANAYPPQLTLGKSRNGTVGSFTVVQDDDDLGQINFTGDDGAANLVPGAQIRAACDGTPGSDDMPGRLEFLTTADGASAPTERMRIDLLGNVFVRTTNTTPGYGNTVQGQVLRDTGAIYGSTYQAFNSFNRSNDGTVISLSSAGGEEGLISISGSTTSYGAFTGSHWSRLADNSKPSILRGTIMESLDTMMDWYQAEADVAEFTDAKGKVTPAYKVREAITLPDGKSVGDAVTFTVDGVEHTGVYKKEDDVKHVKCKVSDTADSTKVYGLFHCWDDQDDGLDGDVNDMEVAQVGTYIIRVHKDVTVSAGDLLVSNGDGTAKKQDDDIIRSKTVAKVNSNVKVETYADGSYTVPCTLHC